MIKSNRWFQNPITNPYHFAKEQPSATDGNALGTSLDDMSINNETNPSTLKETKLVFLFFKVCKKFLGVNNKPCVSALGYLFN